MKQIALLFGGRSLEHTVSLSSATHLLPLLRSLPIVLRLIFVDRTGQLFLCPSDISVLNEETLPSLSQPLTLLYASPREAFFLTEKGEHFFPDGFLSVIHGTFGEDGALQGALSLAEAPFFGPGIAASAIGMHKALSKRLAASVGISVVPYSYHRVSFQSEEEIEAAALAASALLSPFPLFVKPCLSGSSIGASAAKDEASLLSAIRAAAAVSPEILIEKFVQGVELEVMAWEEKGGLAVSPPAEIKAEGAFYDFQTKYAKDGGVRITLPALLPPSVLSLLEENVRTLFSLFGCRHLARMDFFYTEEGRLYFNEVNTSPGFTATSMAPRLLALHGEDTLKNLLLRWISE